jgi:hypothetical protein
VDVTAAAEDDDGAAVVLANAAAAAADMTKELLESLPLEEVKKRTILQQQVRAASTLPLPSHFIPPFVGAASPSLTRHTSALEKPWCISQKRPNSITPCCEGAPTAGACALHAASPTLRRIKRCRLAKV